MGGARVHFLPSELLPALATGTPVLAVCDESSPLGREVQRGAFGAIVPRRSLVASAGIGEMARPTGAHGSIGKECTEMGGTVREENIGPV